MPKSKKEESSTNLDFAGSKDETSPSKKLKMESATASSKSESGGGQDKTWNLDERRAVKINEFRGKVYVDIREYFEDKKGELKPGKKGISLSLEQYGKLKEVVPEIDEALKNIEIS